MNVSATCTASAKVISARPLWSEPAEQDMAVGLGSEKRRRAEAAVSPAVGELEIYICRDPVDFRMGINGLSVFVEGTLKYDPFSRNLFCFVNKRRNQIKVLYWQRTGFCLWLKRLEAERFKWPFHLEGSVVALTDVQFRWLLDGLDLKHLKPHRALEYRTVL
jgi:transposase